MIDVRKILKQNSLVEKVEKLFLTKKNLSQFKNLSCKKKTLIFEVKENFVFICKSDSDVRDDCEYA